MALHAFAVAVQPLIPDFVRSNKSESHARSKRSILGCIVTTTDLDSMHNVIENMKEKSNQIINFENHLVQKVNSITQQMSAFIHAGELNIESLLRSVLHLQSEVIVTAWSQACRDAILELQHLTTAVLGGWAPQGLLHPLERGKLLSANLNNETFYMTFFIECFYAVMAKCRQLKSAPFVCKLPGPSFFRPGRFRDAWTIGIETIVYSEEDHAIAGKPLGEATSCRVKKINDGEVPYFCWGQLGFSGKADSPIVASTSWYAMSIDDYELQTAEFVRKFALSNKVWEQMGALGFRNLRTGAPENPVFPHGLWFCQAVWPRSFVRCCVEDLFVHGYGKKRLQWKMSSQS